MGVSFHVASYTKMDSNGKVTKSFTCTDRKFGSNVKLWEDIRARSSVPRVCFTRIQSSLFMQGPGKGVRNSKAWRVSWLWVLLTFSYFFQRNHKRVERPRLEVYSRCFLMAPTFEFPYLSSCSWRHRGSILPSATARAGMGREC